jgi:anti-anti-sigma regulatory factor
MDTIIINVSSVVAPVLASRDAINSLKIEIEKSASVQLALDFSNVEFISRSAAHELLRIKEWFANQDSQKSVELINTNEEVTKMLRIVASNRAVPKTKEDSSAIKTISIEDIKTPSTSLRFLRRLFAN